ncbi:shikimate kinase [Hyphobacterium sp. CCMP332]|nr:shikimate kinase [Hyphobacterium sp. CCMP332]
MVNISDKKILSLWGMPGAGKTYWGRKLSEVLSLDFIDLDEFVEKESGLRIFEMINQNGETYFRSKEEKALNHLLNHNKRIILSLGGGTPCSKSNFKLLKEKSFSIWINTKIDTIVKNLGNKIFERPLIDSKKDLKRQLEILLEKRKEHYKRADRIVDQPSDIHSILKVIPDSFKNTIRR